MGANVSTQVTNSVTEQIANVLNESKNETAVSVVNAASAIQYIELENEGRAVFKCGKDGLHLRNEINRDSRIAVTIDAKAETDITEQIHQAVTTKADQMAEHDPTLLSFFQTNVATQVGNYKDHIVTNITNSVVNSLKTDVSNVTSDRQGIKLVNKGYIEGGSCELINNSANNVVINMKILNGLHASMSDKITQEAAHIATQTAEGASGAFIRSVTGIAVICVVGFVFVALIAGGGFLIYMVVSKKKKKKDADSSDSLQGEKKDSSPPDSLQGKKKDHHPAAPPDHHSS